MKKLMAANWKMYKTRAEAADTAKKLVALAGALPADREVAIFAPFTALGACAEALAGAKGFFAGGQDVYPAQEGAFTGEVSPAMLKDCACRFVLAGHSERRSVIGESPEFVGQKTAFALKNGLDVVLCVGESLEEREGGRLEQVLRTQLKAGLSDVPEDFAPDSLSIAYEPVWAIGTGKVAGPQEILEAHRLVRKLLADRFGAKAGGMRILYGGSVKPENAAQIIGLDNVDGVLVGGASLQAESFSKIVTA